MRIYEDCMCIFTLYAIPIFLEKKREKAMEERRKQTHSFLLFPPLMVLTTIKYTPHKLINFTSSQNTADHMITNRRGKHTHTGDRKTDKFTEKKQNNGNVPREGKTQQNKTKMVKDSIHLHYHLHSPSPPHTHTYTSQVMTTSPYIQKQALLETPITFTILYHRHLT